MPALPYPKYGLDSLALFPRYGTREDYQKATGQEPPPFTPQRRPKRWFDPKAKSSPRRTVLYDNVLATDGAGVPIPGRDGQPMLDFLALDKDEAATVNIPPLNTNVPGADLPEILAPIRQLEKNEALFFDFGQVAAVKNLDLYPAEDTGFTAQDRALLKAIAAKLGAA